MTKIRAFVGHSFTKDDEAVVHAFLKYFDQLSRSEVDFSWEHAEAAEPRVLAEKVMSLMDDKNLFIAICTKKERVVSPTDLTETVLPSGYLKAKTHKFSWKTSDWIIQEIGLAIGKRLTLFLLVETGVEEPGGLQGDLEYIQFERDFPERSFGKLLEMITALSPRTINSVTTPEITSPPTQTKEEDRKRPEESDWWIPKPDWNRRRYQIAFIEAIHSKKEEYIRSVSDGYLSSPDADHEDNREGWEAFTEYARLIFQEGGTLARLKSLAAAHPQSSKTLEHLALGFAHYDSHADAARTFETASQHVNDAKGRLTLLGRAALEFVRADLNSAALQIVKTMRISSGTVPGGELACCVC